MKHLILWGSITVAAILIIVLWQKTAVITIWDKAESPIYVDVVLFLLGLNLAIARGSALLKKILP